MTDSKDNKEVEVQKDRGHIMTVASAVSGLLASAIGKCFLHPVDTLKAKL